MNNTRQLEQLFKCATDHEIFTNDMGIYAIALEDGTPISQIDMFDPNMNHHGVFTLDLLEIVRDIFTQHIKEHKDDVYVLHGLKAIEDVISILIDGVLYTGGQND